MFEWMNCFKVEQDITFEKNMGWSQVCNKHGRHCNNEWKVLDIKVGYAIDDIYKANKTGIFNSVTPQHTLKFKREKHWRQAL